MVGFQTLLAWSHDWPAEANQAINSFHLCALALYLVQKVLVS